MGVKIGVLIFFAQAYVQQGFEVFRLKKHSRKACKFYRIRRWSEYENLGIDKPQAGMVVLF